MVKLSGKIQENILLNIKNIPGWRTKRKIFIIECDDYGGIRMPSKAIYTNLVNEGLKIEGWFNKYDTLETAQDLIQLFDVLNSVRDKNNHPAVITAVTNVANPDFNKISSSGYSRYYYESFSETLKRYYPTDNVFNLWKEGISSGIFMPELHGREHISVQFWLDKLREGNRNLLFAFENGFVFLNVPGVPGPVREFGTEFFFCNEEQKLFLVNSIKESVSLFRELFEFEPRVFVPGNGIFHPDFDGTLVESGIKFLHLNYSMTFKMWGDKFGPRYFVTGARGSGGLTYYTRNCALEPSNPGYRGVEFTLKQITAAFKWGKPAAVSTHRVNFAGGLDPANRERGLKELRKLLKEVVRRWPEVEFMSAGDALEYMRKSN